MFSITYHITCYEGEAIEEKAQWICLEQSVELPGELISESIRESIVGHIQEITQLQENLYRVEIAWPEENFGNDLTQFLNVLYGNISLKPGIKVIHVNWNQLGKLFNGPAFGISGVRQKFNIEDRPMACAVLKPMGLSAEELSELAYQFALGGIDMIKDDHGLANQSYAPFGERMEKVMAALHRAEKETGRRTRYFPNITTSGSRLMENYKTANDFGVDGVMVIPHTCGYEVMHELAASDIDLPIIGHPAFSGNLVTDATHGFSPAFLYGELYRAFGADFAVYPNTGGRFSFSKDECLALNEAARTDDSPFKPAFPMPGGGMKTGTIPHWKEEYGPDTVFLIGASLLQHPEGIQKAAEEVQVVLG